jgi:hypothetical protein
MVQDLSALFARLGGNPFAVAAPDEAGPVEAAPPLPPVTARSMVRRGEWNDLRETPDD